MEEKSLSLENSQVVRWLVRPGEKLYPGKELLLHKKSGEKELTPLHAHSDGEVIAHLVTEGTVLTKKTKVVKYKRCAHSVEFEGLCADCGQDMTIAHFSKREEEAEEKLPSLAHAPRGIKLSRKEAENLAESVADNLRSRKKLSLILDLDQTLLHSTVDPRAEKVIGSEGTDLEWFQLGRFKYYVSLRPGVREFLSTLAPHFDMYIYTLGVREYAFAIASILDTTGTMFKNKIFSCEDSDVSRTKSLRKLFPCDDSMVAIVDDRSDVWGDAPNVILCEPYHFWARDVKTANPRPDEKAAPEEEHSDPSELWIKDPNPTHMLRLRDVLLDLHRQYYSYEGEVLKTQDAKEILAFLRANILAQCHIVFSGVIPSQQDPTKHECWKIALALGATPQSDVDKRTNYVITKNTSTSSVTDKVKRGWRKRRCTVVHLDWLYFCRWNWVRPGGGAFEVVRPEGIKEDEEEEETEEQVEEEEPKDSGLRIDEFYNTKIDFKELGKDAEEFDESDDDDDIDENPSKRQKMEGKDDSSSSSASSGSDSSSSDSEGGEGKGGPGDVDELLEEAFQELEDEDDDSEGEGGDYGDDESQNS